MCNNGYDEMAAANYSSDVLQMFYGRSDEANQSLPRPLVPRLVPRFDGFKITQNNFQDWLRVWRMDVSRFSQLFYQLQTLQRQPRV